MKALIFDLDGVLVRSEHLYDEAKIRALQKFSFDPSQADLGPYKGQIDLAFFSALKENFPGLRASPEELARESSRIFKEELAHKMVPVEGAVEIIQEAHRRGLVLANVTSATALSQAAALKILKAEKLISVLVNGDTVTHHKPHPEPYIKGLALLGLPPEDCLVIEDTVSGIKSAKAAGLPVAAIGDTFSYDALMAAGADFYVKDHRALREMLTSP